MEHRQQRKNGDRHLAPKRGSEPVPNFRQIQISRRRLWLFRIAVAVVAPILFLTLLEVVLRLVGFGFPASTFVKYKVDGKTVWCSNNKFGWWFFPPQISREFMPFVVPAEKSADTYRIFILGESAAQGDPSPGYCFGRQLEVMLRELYPTVKFEVTTAAMTAINSHAIVHIAEDCARLKPDLFVIYMGNNEVVGPYGAGTVFTPLSKSLTVIRASIAIKATRVGQLLSRISEITSRSGEKPEKWGGLEMFLGKQIRRDDEQMKYVYDHFRKNLEDILKIAHKSGAKVVLSTVAVNLRDCPPFASMHKSGLSEQQVKDFNGLYQEGITLEQAKDFKGAIDKYLACAEIDDTCAEAQFRLGRCLWNIEQFDKAKEHYEKAKELDTLRFRADSQINEIIRKVGHQYPTDVVYFVDSAEEFEKESPHGCPGFELFLEHVHPTFSGNYVLAKTVFAGVEEALAEKTGEKKAKDAEMPGEEFCAKRLAFTISDSFLLMQANLQNISENQPYVNEAYHKEIVEYWKQKTGQIKNAINSTTLTEAIDQYEEALKVAPDDRWFRKNYARLLIDFKRSLPAAAEQYRNIIRHYPQDFSSFKDLATLEMMMNDIDAALKHAVTAVKLFSSDPVNNYTAGAAYQMKGENSEAIKYFNRAIRLNPQLVNSYIRLVQVLNQQGKTGRAEVVIRQGIEANPDNAPLHLELAKILGKRGLTLEANQELQKAMALDPNLARPSRSAPLGPAK
jgi:tetratricopeptide (TPR) repeat protein